MTTVMSQVPHEALISELVLQSKDAMITCFTINCNDIVG